MENLDLDLEISMAAARSLLSLCLFANVSSWLQMQHLRYYLVRVRDSVCGMSACRYC